MPLWFKKKETKPELTPKTGEQKSTDKNSNVSSTLTQELDIQLPLDPIIPVPRPAGLRTFKLPPVHGDGETSGISTPVVSHETASDSVTSEPSLTENPVPQESDTGVHAKSHSVSPSASPQDSDASLGMTRPEVKAVLKPAPVKSRIQVADRSDVPAPKTEMTAADMPNVSRSDPKALYYLLMNGLYDVIFVLDEDGHIMDCNTRTEEIFGYSSDDVWNMPIEKIVYGMNSRMFNILKKNLTNKRHILIDVRCFRSSGTSFLGEVGVSTVQLTRSQNVIFAIRNVERRKNSAEELRKYRAVINALPMPAFACDLHGRFEIMNPPVLKALGMVDEMEAQKKHFGEMLPDMVDRFQVAISGVDVEESKEVTRPDGTVCTLELRLKPMRKGEEITGVAGTIVFS